MQILTEQISIESSDKTDFIDVTDEIKKVICDKKICKGIVNVYTTHTTTAIRINEKEDGLLLDVKKWLDESAPGFKKYKHDDIENRKDVPVDEPANAHSHLKSLIMGASETIPIINSKMVLGEYQRIFFVDLDGPRKRKLIVHILGDE
jgi:secondary thiamine-phosphate synthase enzyme